MPSASFTTARSGGQAETLNKSQTERKPGKFASFNWLRGVSDDKRISVFHRLVLIRHCLHRRNDNGKCSPGYDLIASELGVDRATVFRAVDAGIKWGWIAQPVRHGRQPGDFFFTFPIDPSQPCDGNEPPNVAPERRQKNPKVAPVQRQRRTRAMPKSQAILEANDPESEFAPNGRLNGRLNGRKDSLSPGDASRGKKESLPTREERKTADGFAEFWNAYPKKVAKLAAEKAFAAAAKRGADPAAIIEAAKLYAASERMRIEREHTPQYTKHPATWLNGGCWDDEGPDGAIIDEEGNVVAVENGDGSDDVIWPVQSW
jgi:hypothetical protein